MLARAIKSGLVRGDLESPVRQSSRFDLVFGVDQNIKNLATLFANEMLMAFDQRIEMLRASQHQHLELFVSDQFLEIAINRAQAHVGQTLAHLIINLIRSWVRFVVLDRLPDNLKLFRVPLLPIHLRHNYAVRSSTKDFWVPGSRTALAW